jgi:hypothetical protein
MLKTKSWEFLGATLLTLAVLHMGGCIEAAPFAGGDATDGSTGSEVSPDGTSADSGVTDVVKDEGSQPPKDAVPDGDAPDGSEPDGDEPDAPQSDTTGPCDQVECDCSDDAPCADGLTCHAGACCQPLCSNTVVCGSDGCGGQCGTCGEGEACSQEQACVISCIPGPVCGLGDDADLALVCNQEGTGYDESIPATNCKSSGKSCLNGQCKCIPDCDSESCTDDGGSDGCVGLCPETCADGEFCDEDGACAAEECPTGEVFCHTDDKPYLCEDGTLTGSLEAGQVVDCESNVCLLQDFGDSEGVEDLDDFDLYCACDEPQHCLSADYLHFCNTTTGQSALFQCDEGNVCDETLNACVIPDVPGDAKCCVGLCGPVAECEGTCSCGGGETCSGNGKCYTWCNSFDIGSADCAQNTDKVIRVCESGSPPGLAAAQYWSPYWCEVVEDDVDSTCTAADGEAGWGNAECTNPNWEPEPASSECCAENFGQCGFIDACDGICSCQNSEVYPNGYSCSNTGVCTASCIPDDQGDSHCIDQSAFKHCSANGWWVLTACPDNHTCEDDADTADAKCVDPSEPEQPEDFYSLPLNPPGAGTSPDTGSVVGEHGEVTDHDDFSLINEDSDKPFTVSMWIWGADFNLSTIQPLIRKGGIAPVTTGGSAGSAEWILFVQDERFYWVVYDTEGVAWHKRTHPVTPQIAGNWAHIVVTYPGNVEATPNPHKFTKFYLNGADVTDTSGAGAGSSSATATMYTGSVNGGQDLQIGFTPLPEPTWFSGGIDDVAIVRTYVPSNVLSSMTVGNTQCGADLTQTAVAGDLAAYWRFEDIDSNQASSVSLIGQHTMKFNFDASPWDSPCNSL